ncbi:MAG: PP2C family protein-serine/threonine phosphatase [Acidobacteriia bacterium]|nr:PP2C family protein-serine/threonine phosphatase [Terriglobia bacterium]
MLSDLKSPRFSLLIFLAGGLAIFLLVGFLLWAGFTAPLNSRFPVPAPDGKYFAYFDATAASGLGSEGGFDLVVATPEGRQVGRYPMEAGTIHWSNADHLAVVDQHRTRATLVANADERLLVLTHLDLSLGREPRWCRDGTKLAFVRPPPPRGVPGGPPAGPPEEQLTIFDMQQPQASPVPLPAEFHLRQPVLLAWSPAGEFLFILNVEGREAVLEKIETLTGRVQSLARGLAAGGGRLPQVSPDGTKIYLPPPQPSVIDAQSGETLWTLPERSDVLWQAWSSDGRLYYYGGEERTDIRAHDFVNPSDEIVASGVQPNGFFAADGRTYFFRVAPLPAGGGSAATRREWGENSWGWYVFDRLTTSPQPLGRLELWPWEQTLDGLVLARRDDHTAIRYGLYDPDARALDGFTFPSDQEDLRHTMRANHLILTTVGLYALLALVVYGLRRASAPARAFYILLLLLMALVSGQSSLVGNAPVTAPLPYRLSSEEIQRLGWWMASAWPQFVLDRVLLGVAGLWALLPIVFLHFGLVFPEGNHLLGARKGMRYTLYGVSALPLVGWWAERRVPSFGGNLGRGLLIFAGLVALVTWVVSLRANFLRPPERRSRDQIRWMILGLGLAAVGGLVALLAIGMEGLFTGESMRRFFSVFRAGTLAATGWVAPLAAAYAVSAVKPYSLHLLFRRLLRHTLMGLPPLALFIVIWAAASWVLAGSLLAKSAPAVMVAVLLTVLITMPFRGRLRLLADRTFDRTAFEFRERLMNIARGLPHLLDRETLATQLAEVLSKAMGTNWVCLLALDRQTKKLRLVRGKGRLPAGAADMEFAPDEAFCEYLRSEVRPFEVEVSPYKPELTTVVRSAADRLGILLAAVVLGLKRRHELLGLLVLGTKNSGDFYDADELDLLSTVAREAAIALENIDLFEEVARDRELRRELEDASDVQAQLFPSIVPRLAGAQVVGYCFPARATGADYYDFLELSDQRLGLAICDVSGKGMSACLLMASVQRLLREQAVTAESLADLVRKLNRQLYASSRDAKYCTMVYAVYDDARRELEYVNAGHNPPLVVTDGNARFLQPTGLPLGLFSEASHHSERVTLAPGAVLVLYTDGLTETRNARGESFGVGRLVSAVIRAAEGDAERVAARILADVREFEGGAPLEDDQTLVLLKVKAD